MYFSKANKYSIAFLMWVVLSLTSWQSANAQVSSSGISYTIELEAEAVDGDVVCALKGGYGLCSLAYSPAMFGVVTKNPAAQFSVISTNKTALVTSQGTALVRVKSSGGNIKKGDFLTTSKTPGVAVLATQNGYVLGVAQDDYSASDPEAVGLIQASINIHPEASIGNSRSNLLQVIKEGFAAPIFGPLESLRYILAAGIVLVSFTLGFIYFGRMARTGVEAIGRNPLASRAIELSVIFHIIITIVIIAAGVGIAYLILIM